MTNEEAIGMLLYISSLLYDNNDIEDINKALAMAIKALSGKN